MNSVKIRKIIRPDFLSRIKYHLGIVSPSSGRSVPCFYCNRCAHSKKYHTEAEGFEEFVIYCKHCKYYYGSYYKKYKEDKHHG